MENKKATVEFTKDNRRKADIVINKAGFIEFSKDVVIRIEDEEFDNPSKPTKLFKIKVRRDNNVTE